MLLGSRLRARSPFRVLGGELGGPLDLIGDEGALLRLAERGILPSYLDRQAVRVAYGISNRISHRR